MLRIPRLPKTRSISILIVDESQMSSFWAQKKKREGGRGRDRLGCPTPPGSVSDKYCILRTDVGFINTCAFDLYRYRYVGVCLPSRLRLEIAITKKRAERKGEEGGC